MESMKGKLCRAAAILGICASVMLLYRAIFYRPAQEALPQMALSGAEIALVQAQLREAGFYSGETSGVLNLETSRALRDFQRFFGIGSSGLPDGETRALLRQCSDAQPDRTAAELLARFIDARCGEGSWPEMIACGEEILARVANPQYPDTIAGVILQSGAYPAAGWLRRSCSDRARAAAYCVLRQVAP